MDLEFFLTFFSIDFLDDLVNSSWNNAWILYLSVCASINGHCEGLTEVCALLNVIVVITKNGSLSFLTAL